MKRPRLLLPRRRSAPARSPRPRGPTRPPPSSSPTRASSAPSRSTAPPGACRRCRRWRVVPLLTTGQADSLVNLVVRHDMELSGQFEVLARGHGARRALHAHDAARPRRLPREGRRVRRARLLAAGGRATRPRRSSWARRTVTPKTRPAARRPRARREARLPHRPAHADDRDPRRVAPPRRPAARGAHRAARRLRERDDVRREGRPVAAHLRDRLRRLRSARHRARPTPPPSRPPFGPGGAIFYGLSVDYSPFRVVQGPDATPVPMTIPGSVMGLAFSADRDEDGAHRDGRRRRAACGSATRATSSPAPSPPFANHPVFGPMGKVAYVAGSPVQRIYVDGKPISPAGFMASAPVFCDTPAGAAARLHGRRRRRGGHHRDRHQRRERPAPHAARGREQLPRVQPRRAPGVVLLDGQDSGTGRGALHHAHPATLAREEDLERGRRVAALGAAGGALRGPARPPRTAVGLPRTPMGLPRAVMEPPRAPMGLPRAVMEPPRAPMGLPRAAIEPPRAPMGLPRTPMGASTDAHGASTGVPSSPTDAHGASTDAHGASTDAPRTSMNRSVSGRRAPRRRPGTGRSPAGGSSRGPSGASPGTRGSLDPAPAAVSDAGGTPSDTRYSTTATARSAVSSHGDLPCLPFAGSSSTWSVTRNRRARGVDAVWSARAISMSAPLPAARISAWPASKSRSPVTFITSCPRRVSTRSCPASTSALKRCARSRKSSVRASAAACALRSSSRRAFASSSALDSVPRSARSLSTSLPRRCELAAQLLVDGRRLVELGLEVVRRRRQLGELRVAVLRGGLGGGEALLQGGDAGGVVLLLGLRGGLVACAASATCTGRRSFLSTMQPLDPSAGERRRGDEEHGGARSHARPSYPHAGRSTTSPRAPPTTTPRCPARPARA